jgi:hypothetical protein
MENYACEDGVNLPRPYGSYNLFKLPTTAAWRKAHAL